jgi:hypothetical protein
MENKYCKGCNSSVHISKEEIEKVFGKKINLKGIKLTTQNEYEYRINICKQCEAYIYNSTCKYCGCLMEIKAKFKASKCIFPYNPKW